MDFDERLQKAIDRGRRAGDARVRAEAQKALSEKELRRLHGQYRIGLTERIEHCLRQLTQQVPGFDLKPVVSDRGWGAAVSRDDLDLRPGRSRSSRFSRLEMLVSPLGKSFVLEMTAKATIRNKEIFSRTHYQKLPEVDLHAFTELVDLWVLEFAEAYAARS
jgi:hypothetical protein